MVYSIKSQPIHDSSFKFDNSEARIKSLTLSFYYSYGVKQLSLNVSKDELSFLNRLCRNKGIAITRPDTENGVVNFNGTDFFSKAMSILDNTPKFTPLDTNALDINQKRENKLILFLWDLVKKSFVPYTIYHDLFSTGSTPGILHRLPKVHKLTFPLDLRLDSAIKFSLSKN